MGRSRGPERTGTPGRNPGAAAAEQCQQHGGYPESLIDEYDIFIEHKPAPGLSVDFLRRDMI